MARYRKVDVRIWGDDRVRKLSRPPPNARDLWLYLLTAKESTALPGAIPAGMAMAETLRWPVEAFREAFREVSREGLAMADWEAPLVWIPKAVKYNPPESPNVIKAWKKVWDELPDSHLKPLIWRALADHVKGMGKGFREAFREAFREGCPNQEPEQEPEQDLLLRAAAAAPLAHESLPVSLPPTLPDSLPEPLPKEPTEAKREPSPKPRAKARHDTSRDVTRRHAKSREPDARHAPLLKRLCEAFEAIRGAAFPVDGHQAKALSSLLAKGTDAEILECWSRALGSDEYPRVRTLAELDKNWTHFTGVGPPKSSRPAPPPVAALAVGRTEQPQGKCEACGAEGNCADAWGRLLCAPGSREGASCYSLYRTREGLPEGEPGVLQFIAEQRTPLEPPFPSVPPPRLEAVPAVPRKKSASRAKLGSDPFAGMPGPVSKRKAVPA